MDRHDTDLYPPPRAPRPHPFPASRLASYPHPSQSRPRTNLCGSPTRSSLERENEGEADTERETIEMATTRWSTSQRKSQKKIMVIAAAGACFLQWCPHHHGDRGGWCLLPLMMSLSSRWRISPAIASPSWSTGLCLFPFLASPNFDGFTYLIWSRCCWNGRWEEDQTTYSNCKKAEAFQFNLFLLIMQVLGWHPPRAAPLTANRHLAGAGQLNRCLGSNTTSALLPYIDSSHVFLQDVWGRAHRRTGRSTPLSCMSFHVMKSKTDYPSRSVLPFDVCGYHHFIVTFIMASHHSFSIYAVVQFYNRKFTCYFFAWFAHKYLEMVQCIIQE